MGLDPYYQIAYAVGPQGVDLLRLDDGQVISRERPAELAGRAVTAAQRSPNDVLALGTDDGHLLLAQVRFQLDYSSGQRQVVPQFAVERLVAVDPGRRVAGAGGLPGGGGRPLGGGCDYGEWPLGGASGRATAGPIGAGRAPSKAVRANGRTRRQGHAGAARWPHSPDAGGYGSGQVYEWRLGAVEQAPAFVGHIAVSEVAVSALAYALGEVSLVVGDAAGHVSAWFKVEEDGQRSYRRIHAFAPSESAVTHIVASTRDKQFLTADAEGAIALHHLTSEHTSFQLPGDSPVTALVFAPKADGFLASAKTGGCGALPLTIPIPKSARAVLFGSIWYEGYGAANTCGSPLVARTNSSQSSAWCR